MKKAAIFLLMSSSAFAAQTVTVASSTTTPTAQTAPQAKKKAPQKAPPKAPQKVTVQKAAPQSAGVMNSVLKRAPKQALMTNAPAEPGLQAPKFGNWELKAQLRGTMTMANAEELQNEGGKNFGLSNEIRLGLKHQSGWGFNVTGSYQTDNYADPSGDAGTNGDASLMIIHPSIFKNATFDFHGVLRIYAPTSEKSRENDIRSASYYSFIDMTFAKRFSASNLTFIRGFTQPNPTETSTQSVIVNALEFAHATTKTIALSFGGQFEADNARAGTSTEFDLYPFIDFTFIPNVLIEPKYYFPVYVGGNRQVNASGAALNQTQAELFIKIGI